MPAIPTMYHRWSKDLLDAGKNGLTRDTRRDATTDEVKRLKEENETLKRIPMWGLDVATIIHYYEAILATLAIIVWHLYYVVLNPDFAPMSFTWIDGKLSRYHMEHEHPLELEELDEARRRGEDPRPGSTMIFSEED